MKRIEDLSKTEIYLVINQKLENMKSNLERGLLDFVLWREITDLAWYYINLKGNNQPMTKYVKINEKVQDIIKNDYNNFIIMDEVINWTLKESEVQ